MTAPWPGPPRRRHEHRGGGDPGHDHDHDQGPDHDQGHGHGHGGGAGLMAHAREAGRRRLTLVLAITGSFMVVEFVGGLLANSLALLADAAHMLTDVAALGLSLFAFRVARRPATRAKTYGYVRVEILAATVNAVTLIVLAVFIVLEAIERFRDPVAVQGGLMLGVALAGLAVNVAGALLLHRSAGESLNLRGAYLHVLGDLLGSVGAIAAAVVIVLTGWTPADPLISVLVAGLILVSSWRLLRESVDVLLEAVPAHLDLEEIRAAIGRIDGVRNVSDLHVWTVTSGFIAMSGHVEVDAPDRAPEILARIHDRMHEEFGISHVTVQVEQPRMYRIGDLRSEI